MTPMDHGANIASQMSLLVFQLGFLVMGAFFLGRVFEKFRLPRVLGEIMAGVVFGPHLLGVLALPGFPSGLFPEVSGTVPVSPELYGFGALASVLLLFSAGLETDLGMFRKFALKGGFIGLLEVGLDFILGVGITALILGVSPWSPSALILGLILTATSVGVTARNLMENRKMDSPEGITILSTAVFDDVLGIIVLAVVLGILGTQAAGGTLDLGAIGLLSLKAVGLWLGFTLLGLASSRRLGHFIKKFRSPGAFTLLSLGLAFLLAGLFERAGLAMIIGAYVMGLTLAATDLGLVVQERIRPLKELLVPLFFAIMGMMVDPSVFLDLKLLGFGLAYSLMAMAGKIIGSGGPSLIMGFNRLGALRIGLGMIPRGEVALIIAGIGTSAGFLPRELLGAVIMMSVITILVSTTSLRWAFALPGRGTRREDPADKAKEIEFPVRREILEPLVSAILTAMDQEGFFIHRMEAEEVRYVFRKDDVSFSLRIAGDRLVFLTTQEDSAFIRTLLYETLIGLHSLTHALKRSASPELLARELADENARATVNLAILLDPQLVSLELKGKNKEEVLHEMIQLLSLSPKVKDPESLKASVLAREKTMSTGMEWGIALPHGRCPGLDEMVVAVGIHKKGVDFQSLDGAPAHIFIALASPEGACGPHLQFLSTVAGILKSERKRTNLLSARNPYTVINLLSDAREG